MRYHNHRTEFKITILTPISIQKQPLITINKMKNYISKWIFSVYETIPKAVFTLSTLVALHQSSQAQTTPKLQDPSNTFIATKALDIDPGGGIIYFKDHELLQGQLFTQYFSVTGLSISDSMHLVGTTHDSILADEGSPAPDLAHNLYQQYYKGIPVEGGIYIEHYESIDGNVLSTGGFLVENLNLSVTPQVSEAAALNLIRTDLNFEFYEWDSTGIYPKGELTIIASPTEENSYLLAWKFPIHLSMPFYAQDVYVNAYNGKIEKKTPLTNNGGIFNHYLYGMKYDLDTKRDVNWLYADDFYLFANDDTRNIYTTDDNTVTSPLNITWVWQNMPQNVGSDNWGATRRSATSTHYVVQKAWDFYKQSFPNRTGMTGWGRHVRVHADWDWTRSLTQNPGPFYYNQDNQDYIIMTKTNTNGNLCAYDIVAHEFTHGVIRNSVSPLIGIKVPGAINESFADIFGMVSERYTKGGVYNWIIGEDALPVRNMQTPNAYGHPSYYLEKNRWIDPTSPTASSDGGAHTNLGVQNKWFYLLSMGGSQPIYLGFNNVLQPTRTVSGIGIDKAARIAYYAMANFVNSGGEKDLTFNAVRASTINAARILYGYCSNEYVQTCRAWYAVNVGLSCDPCSGLAPNWYSRNFPYQQPSDFKRTGLTERENQVAKMKVFPNPASDKIKVMVEEVNTDLGDNNYTLNILAVDGKLVFSSTYSNIENVEVNIDNLQKGIYFINISNSKWTRNTKFVKQ